MRLKRFSSLALLVFVSIGWAGCGDGTSTSPNPAGGNGLAVFTDPSSGFSTTDVRDIDDQIVQFKPSERTLFWIQDNLLFDGWIVDGNFLGEGHPYQVRFGTVNGERRAYFTETGRGTICDLEVQGNVLQLFPTDTLPPTT